MPRSKEKKVREQPSNATFSSAVKDVVENHLSVRGAAEKHNISKSALARHVKVFKASGAETYQYRPHYDTQKVFSEDQENMLVNYLKQAAYMHYGLTIRDLRKLAYEFAKINQVVYPKKWDDEGMAGEGWTKLFRQRHSSSLSLRKPEATSLSRATSFNKHNVGLFFSNYTQVLGRNNFGPEKIYNLDETGLSTVQNPPKILAPKGIKAIGGMTSGERGTNVTMIAAVNALGNSVPPLFVFPRVNFRDHMLKGAPPGSIGAAAQSGWSNEDIFYQFFEHFVNHTKPTIENPIILLLDNHESHVSVKAITLAKKVGVFMVTFYPHTSHKMQPLDRTVFGPFKTYYHRVVTDWMSTPGNQGKPLTIYDVAECAGKAYAKAFTPANIIEGFKVTGIYPMNQNIFLDHEFLSANVTDRPLVTDQNSQANLDIQQPTTSSVLSPPLLPHTSSTQTSQTHVQNSLEPKSSGLIPINQLTPQVLQKSLVSPIVTPEMVRPFPKAEARKKQSNKESRKGKSKIMTDTPEKDEIEKLKKKKQEEKEKNEKVKRARLEFSNKSSLKEADLKRRREKMKKVRLNLSKKFHKGKRYSSSEDEDLTTIIEEPNNDNNEDFLDMIEIDYPEAKDLEKSLEIDNVNIGDYVLVKFEGKKNTKHFVAKITNKPKQDNEMFSVIYLKKCLDSERFRMQDETETFDLCAEDIKLKLPDPVCYGGTERLQKQLKFPVSFSGYNIH